MKETHDSKKAALLPKTTRREFIWPCGQRAIWAPPSIAVILAASASPIYAQSSYQRERVNYGHLSGRPPGQTGFDHGRNPFTQFFHLLARFFGD
jgi:hypothetical protein